MSRIRRLSQPEAEISRRRGPDKVSDRASIALVGKWPICGVLATRRLVVLSRLVARPCIWAISGPTRP